MTELCHSCLEFWRYFRACSLGDLKQVFCIGSRCIITLWLNHPLLVLLIKWSNCLCFSTPGRQISTKTYGLCTFIFLSLQVYMITILSRECSYYWPNSYSFKFVACLNYKKQHNYSNNSSQIWGCQLWGSPETLQFDIRCLLLQPTINVTSVTIKFYIIS